MGDGPERKSLDMTQCEIILSLLGCSPISNTKLDESIKRKRLYCFLITTLFVFLCSGLGDVFSYKPMVYGRKNTYCKALNLFNLCCPMGC